MCNGQLITERKSVPASYLIVCMFLFILVLVYERVIRDGGVYHRLSMQSWLRSWILSLHKIFFVPIVLFFTASVLRESCASHSISVQTSKLYSEQTLYSMVGAFLLMRGTFVPLVQTIYYLDCLFYTASNFILKYKLVFNQHCIFLTMCTWLMLTFWTISMF